MRSNGSTHFVEFNNDPKYYNMTFRELRNRRALTGESCTINKLIGVVGVGSWAKAGRIWAKPAFITTGERRWCGYNSDL